MDLHTHHARCGHAEGDLLTVARRAHAAGVRLLGWSDHAPLFGDPADHPKPGVQMARSQWPAYLEEAEAVRARLRRELPDLELRVGAEADYLPGTEAAYREALADPRLDYVLGSVHEVNGWHVYKPETWEELDEPDEFHLAYWRQQRASASSGLFDVIAHLDAIKAMAPAPRRDMRFEVEATLNCIADCGVAVEINASGLRKAGEAFPSPEIVAGLVRRDVPITFGSDAHRFDQLGVGYESAVELLHALGCTRLITFRGREPEWRPLDAFADAGR